MVYEPKVGNIEIENAKLVFRNFKGEKSTYNKNGLRTFCVLLDDDMADTLLKDGWNPKWLEPREEGDERQAYLQVKVHFNPEMPSRNPKIMAITGGGSTFLGEDEVAMLDWAEFAHVDLVIRPYPWDVLGKTGIAAYLKSMYATLIEDAFEAKYRKIPAGLPVDVNEPLTDDN